MEKTKSLKKEVLTKGYLLYFYDIRHFESELIPLPRISTTIELRDYNERFDLDKPAFYITGLPVWIVFRNLPFSIEFNDFETLNEEKLGFKIPTSSEIQSKAHSLYTKMIFGKKMVDNSYYLISLLLCVLVGVIVHLIDRIVFVEPAKTAETTQNATESVVSMINLFRISRMVI